MLFFALLGLLNAGRVLAVCEFVLPANAVSTCNPGANNEDGFSCSVTCLANFALGGVAGKKSVSLGCFSSSWDKDPNVECERRYLLAHPMHTTHTIPRTHKTQKL